MKFAKLQFNSHKNHNPNYDILEGWLSENGPYITYNVCVKDYGKGKVGDEGMEYYQGENYGGTGRSFSRQFPVDKIPAKFKSLWQELKSIYEKKYKKASVGESAKSVLRTLVERVIKEEEDGKYTIVNGTAYDKKTPQEVIDVLETVRQNGQRITIDLGDPITGKSWGERYDITGKVGRSSGQYKIPILVHNSRSMGGGGILTASIIAIKTSSGNRFLYKHPKYQPYQEPTAEALIKETVWTVEKIKEELPPVKVKLRNGKIVQGNIYGRKLAFPVVSVNTDAGELTAEFSWTTLLRALESNSAVTI